MHKIYSSAGNMSIYVVVFNLEWLLGKHTCNSRCDKDCERNEKDTILFIKFWLNSIARNSNGAPVVLIGSHKDKVVSGADLTTKSNVELATSNGDIERANKIIGQHVRSMKVYQQKLLNLCLPEQPRSLHTICLVVQVAVHMLMHDMTLQMKLLTMPPLSGSTQLTTNPEERTIAIDRQIRCLRSYARKWTRWSAKTTVK